MRIAREAWFFVLSCLGVFGVAGAGCLALDFTLAAKWLLLAGIAVAGFVLFFFRDPERTTPDQPGNIVSGADGVVRAIDTMREDAYLGCSTVRVSVFLSVFNVHVNRSPVTGMLRKLVHTPGKRLFAFLDAASEYNEHNALLIEGKDLTCLVRQIVGPVARRVVSWKQPGDRLEKGERFGIMKFGSRLDVYLPEDRVEILVRKGQRVVAGVSVIARLKDGERV